MRLFGRKPSVPVDERRGPYRAQRIDPPRAPPRRGRLAVPLALAACIGLMAWCCGGFDHLPWRARTLCSSSPAPGEAFSPASFRRRARLLALTWRGERSRPQGERESWALGSWIFLRCSCAVTHRDGRVVSKRVHCFD